MSDCKCDVLCDDILPSLVRCRSRLSCRFPKGEGWMKCLLCEDTGWVCENHPDQPWQGPHACASDVPHFANIKIAARGKTIIAEMSSESANIFVHSQGDNAWFQSA